MGRVKEGVGGKVEGRGREGGRRRRPVWEGRWAGGKKRRG